MDKFLGNLVLKYLNNNRHASDKDIYLFVHDIMKERNNLRHANKIYFTDDTKTVYWSRAVANTISYLLSLGIIIKTKCDDHKSYCYEIAHEAPDELKRR